jgi:hypothetical protein
LVEFGCPALALTLLAKWFVNSKCYDVVLLRKHAVFRHVVVGYSKTDVHDIVLPTAPQEELEGGMAKLRVKLEERISMFRRGLFRGRAAISGHECRNATAAEATVVGLGFAAELQQTVGNTSSMRVGAAGVVTKRFRWAPLFVGRVGSVRNLRRWAPLFVGRVGSVRNFR